MLGVKTDGLLCAGPSNADNAFVEFAWCPRSQVGGDGHVNMGH